MNAKSFALVGGIMMLVIGALALIPVFSGVAFALPLLKIETSYGLFLGLFALNIVNKVILIVLGLWGVAAASDPALAIQRSVSYCRAVFIMTGAFAILGLFQQTNTLFGLAPLFGASIWLHATLALVAGIFGFSVAQQMSSAH